ncbi:MAG: NAD(P)H-dependent oxidoreductase [Campylobacterales bacterium]|nr:NAD(P)H-dependent oxidoreductase [Campylobacterales bacterium]
MKNILIINGHQYAPMKAEGNLTKAYIQKAEEFFIANGFDVKHSVCESDFDVAEELEKFQWADDFLFQYPVFWMSVPWTTKKFIDEVFSGGKGKVTFANDGRSSEDKNKRYGSGGMLCDKKYMLSMTYNCPTSEFDDKEGFFDGFSLDEANIATHKTFQFCGMKPLESYSVHDIFKGNLDLEGELSKFEEVLKKNFL